MAKDLLHEAFDSEPMSDVCDVAHEDCIDQSFSVGSIARDMYV